MSRAELQQKIERGFTPSYGPAKAEPQRGALRTTLVALRKYEADLRLSQRYQDSAQVAPTLLFGGMPIYAPASEATESDISALWPPTAAAQHAEAAAPGRVGALSSLLDEWLADESGYDEATWPELAQALDRARTSDRRLFGE